MTGEFVIAGRQSPCVMSDCRNVIRAGERVYLFKKLEQQTVCLDCAKARWGYEPLEAAPSSTPAATSERIGFDSTKSILKSLQQANANDPKFRQSGGDR